MPSLQNPSASVMSRRRRQEIARVARRLNLWVVEDDVYGFLIADVVPVAALVPERTFYLSSLSKSVVPGLRVGVLRVPPGWIDRVIGAVFATTVTVTPISAAAAALWMDDGTAARIVAWKRSEVRARQQIARSILGDRVSGSPESQHLWLALPEQWMPEDFAREARQRGIVVTPGREFAVARHEAPHGVRLCLGPPAERQSLKRALTTLQEIISGSPEAFGTSI
jgi:DNA-binding transcriptional MocR family regulator